MPGQETSRVPPVHGHLRVFLWHHRLLTRLEIVRPRLAFDLSALCSRLRNTVSGLTLIAVVSLVAFGVQVGVPLRHGHHHRVRLDRVRHLEHVLSHAVLLMLDRQS